MTTQRDAQDPSMPDPETIQTLTQMIMGFRVSQMVHVAAKLGIADLLKSGPQTAGDLAQATSTHAPSLYRLLRGLASLGIFAEDEQARFALTPLAELLRTGVPGTQRSKAIFHPDQPIWQSWGELLRTVTTGEPAFRRIYGTDVWKYRALHPELNARFNAFMSDATTLFTPSIVAAYDFTGIGTLVDVGGGEGPLISAILAANPQLKGILCDAPHVVSAARPHLEAAGVIDRCELRPCDFFSSVPEGGDAYILKSILHDWDDDLSAAILTTCRRAMPEHGRLLLVENVITPGNSPHPAKLVDLQMLVELGGRERTEAEFRDLLAGAGFRLTRVLPTEVQFSIIEAIPV